MCISFSVYLAVQYTLHTTQHYLYRSERSDENHNYCRGSTGRIWGCAFSLSLSFVFNTSHYLSGLSFVVSSCSFCLNCRRFGLSSVMLALFCNFWPNCIASCHCPCDFYRINHFVLCYSLWNHFCHLDSYYLLRAKNMLILIIIRFPLVCRTHLMLHNTFDGDSIQLFYPKSEILSERAEEFIDISNEYLN